MKKSLYRRGFSMLLAVCLLLGCVSCGGAPAATMHLRKTEGTVGIADDEGKNIAARNNLGLYDGYQVETETESYAWIDLDSVKLTKMDEDSEIQIKKDGKHLEIEVKSGALFFNVTEPLGDDESLTIRASSMTVGIRGTCGWVEVSDGTHMTLYLLEGTVECTAGDETVTVSAGEIANMSVVDGQGVITVTALQEKDIPVFVADELESSQPDEGDESLSTLKEEWPHITESVLEDGTIYIVEYYEDGSWIERMTRDDFSSVQERDALGRAVRHEETFGSECFLKTYRYLENSSEVVISAHWTKDGETMFLVENFSYTMSDPDNGVRVSGTSSSGGIDDYVRTLRISEFQMDTFKNLRDTAFVLDMGGTIIETRDEGRYEGYYG